jgi:heme oxygenase (staphylobilin-producing)
MFVILRTITVKKGFADQVVERFSRRGPVHSFDGFIDSSVMVKRAKRQDEHDEVVVMVRWRSQEDWKNWEKSPEHIQGHRQKQGQTPPDYVISTVHAQYDVKTVIGPLPKEAQADA